MTVSCIQLYRVRAMVVQTPAKDLTIVREYPRTHGSLLYLTIGQNT